MRRLVSGLRDYPRALAHAIGRNWTAFFFTPADPTSLGLIRALVGLLLFWSMLVYGLDLRSFLGSDGWADPALVRELMSQQMPTAWSFWLWVPDTLLRPVWIGCLVVLVLFTLGLGSRYTAILAWVIAVSTARRIPASLYGFDQIITAWAFYLAVTGASGQAVSLDRLLDRWRQAREKLTRRPLGAWPVPPAAPEPTISANLALRLIQLHLALVYGTAGLAKLQGAAWWTGTAAWGVVAAAEFRRFNLTWLLAYPLLLNAFTHVGLLLEISYPVLIWSRILRPLLLASVCLMHVGIDLTLGLTEFGLAMVAGNLAFVSGPWLRSLVAGREQPAGRLLFEGSCPRCRRAMAWVAALDPDHVVEPVDVSSVDLGSVHAGLSRESCKRSLHLVRSDGRVVVGFDALWTLAGWSPWTWPVALLGWLPGVAWAGRKVYNARAAQRLRAASGSDNACGLHPFATHPNQGGPSTLSSSGRSSR